MENFEDISRQARIRVWAVTWAVAGVASLIPDPFSALFIWAFPIGMLHVMFPQARDFGSLSLAGGWLFYGWLTLFYYLCCFVSCSNFECCRLSCDYEAANSRFSLSPMMPNNSPEPNPSGALGNSRTPVAHLVFGSGWLSFCR